MAREEVWRRLQERIRSCRGQFLALLFNWMEPSTYVDFGSSPGGPRGFLPEQLLCVGILREDAQMVDGKPLFPVGGRYIRCEDRVGEELIFTLGDITPPAGRPTWSLDDLDGLFKCHSKYGYFFGLAILTLAIGDEEVRELLEKPQMEHYSYNEVLPKIAKLL